MNKAQVKEKIIRYCKLFGFETPKNWDYLSVKKIADKINMRAEISCPFCGKENGVGFSMRFCECEIKRLTGTNI